MLEVLRKPRLPTGRRGYDISAVETLLATAADAIERLENEAAGAALILQQRDAELHDLRGRFQPLSDSLAEKDAQLRTAQQALHESMAAAAAAAQAAERAPVVQVIEAAPVVEPAAPESASSAAATDEAALILLQQARETAAAAIAEAHRAADDVRSNAEDEARRLRAAAEREAAAQRQAASDAVATINDEAERRLEEMDGELAARRRAFDDEITDSEQRLNELDDLLARRSQLLAAEARRLGELAERLRPATDEIDLTEVDEGVAPGEQPQDVNGVSEADSRLTF